MLIGKRVKIRNGANGKRADLALQAKDIRQEMVSCRNRAEALEAKANVLANRAAELKANADDLAQVLRDLGELA